MRNDKRFEIVYKQGTLDVVEILIDNETGVHYVYRTNGYAGGMTVLIDKEGKPVVTSVEKNEW